MTTVTAQTYARSITGTTWDWDGDAHALCDFYSIPAGDLAARLGELARLVPAVAMMLYLTRDSASLSTIFTPFILLQEDDFYILQEDDNQLLLEA